MDLLAHERKCNKMFFYNKLSNLFISLNEENKVPELTIEIMAQCKSCSSYSSEIGGYKQIITNRFLPQCTCKAFYYSKHPKNCKHLKEAREKQCGWHQQFSDEVQTKKGICPRCGEETEYVKVGV